MQPFPERGQRLRVGVMGEDSRMDDRIIRAGEEVAGQLARLGRHPADDGRRAELVARRHPLLLAHVAVLAGYAARRCRRHPVFAVRLLQPEAIEQGHVVAGAAEYGVGKIGELLDLVVDLASRLFRVGDDPVDGILQHPRQFLVAGRAVHGIGQAAFDQGEAAADLVVGPVDTVAHHAGDAFARGGMALEVGNGRGLAQVRPHLAVTTQAEIAVGSVRQFIDLVAERKIYGTQLRV